MISTTFEQWFAELFGQNVSEVKNLLEDTTAVQFLIAWSLFESRCFSGFVKVEKIQNFADNITSHEKFDVSSISEHANYFHARYKDGKVLCRNLMHKQKCEKFEVILELPFRTLTSLEQVFLSTFVIYRFRNNIFHGNKGVNRWLKFKEQIDRCTNIMQQLISLVESDQPQFKVV